MLDDMERYVLLVVFYYMVVYSWAATVASHRAHPSAKNEDWVTDSQVVVRNGKGTLSGTDNRCPGGL